MKPKRNYKTSTKKPAALDLCQTPPYALEPIIRYIPKKAIIWDPGSGEGILANALRVAGFRVVESDIALGQDFFEYQPERWDVIITNPPYGIKPAWTRRTMELGKPFCLLMPTEFQGVGAAIDLFDEYGIRIMDIAPRINFKMPVQGWFSSAQFPTSWYSHSILPDWLMFVKQKPFPRTVSRQVWKRDKKTGEMKLVTEWGYADWIERPSGYDAVNHRFIYKELMDEKIQIQSN